MNATIWWVTLGAAAVLAAAILLRKTARPRAGRLPRGARVHLTRHARDRMAERDITAAEIESVLAKPARHTPDPVERSVRLERDFGDCTLKVWVVAPWPNREKVTVKSTARQYATDVTVPPGSLPHVIGKGGSAITRLREETGAHIVIQSNASIRITAGTRNSVEAAEKQILTIANRPRRIP